MTTSAKRETPINLRALPAQRDLIDRARQLTDKSRTEFVLQAACREAENTLLDQRLFVLDEQRFAAFEDSCFSLYQFMGASLWVIVPWRQQRSIGKRTPGERGRIAIGSWWSMGNDDLGRRQVCRAQVMADRARWRAGRGEAVRYGGPISKKVLPGMVPE